ncbi:MAG: GTP cyclohydrolase I FolE [Candidatus Zixiibacteriota bacterium]|nr:MAG: GTP cyclohydrolase I FolE [candidate division Zixibacteria bacterium]
MAKNNPVEEAYRTILKSVGEDLDREGLKKTPSRAADALRHLTRGYTEDPVTIIDGSLFTADTDEMIIVKDIELYSLCEHHLLPFIGKCHVGYLPGKSIIGLSKIARVVDIFARRLQVQERLTRQIADTLMERLDAVGVGVVIEAQHLCTMMRGVEKQNLIMKTSCLLGGLRNNPSTRAEFLDLIR